MSKAEPTNPRSDKEIFFEALDLATPEERAAFLDGACGNDAAQRRRVTELLALHIKQNPFMQEPAAEGSPAALSPAPLADVLGAQIGRYKLLEKLGEGGFGAVYVAEQKEPVKRRVALKIIKLGMDTRQVVARFEAERQALALMDHPNIAKVLDGGATDTGRLYFVMELVRGVPITRFCEENNLTTVERIKLFILVCHAIQHAHQKGIIHRDIKPSNIMVTLHDGVPVPKVIDFGIAKAIEGELTDKTVYTQFQQFIGTPAYMSPEQAEMSGLGVDTRTDIYAVGVLLYELLVGKTPFDAKELLESGLDEMRRTIRETEPVKPSTRLTQTLVAADVRRLKSPSSDAQVFEEEVRASSRRLLQIKETITLLKGDLDWIVMKCLEKDRTRRYATANDLAADLQRHLSNEPVLARPPSQLYRFQKMMRRNKATFITAVSLAGLLLAGTVVSTWQAIRATRAQASEAHQRRRAEKSQANETQLRNRAEMLELASRRFAYASDMNLAHHALAANNLGRAQELLNRHRPQPGQVDLRGWEWRYLWKHCRSEALFTLCKVPGPVNLLVVSQDGKWVVVGNDGNPGLVVWNLPLRQEVAKLPVAARSIAAFSPTKPLLAFAGASTNRQNRVWLWDGNSGTIVGEIPLRSRCLYLAFDRDGQVLLAGTDNEIELWDVSGRRKLATYPPVQHFGSELFAVSPDLSAVAYSTGGVHVISLVDLATGKPRWTTKATDDWLMSLAFSADGKLLASGAGYEDGDIRLWDTASGKEVGRLQGHGGWVSALEFSSDGKTLASASADQTIRLWDPITLKPSAVLRGHKLEVWRLGFGRATMKLVSGSKDGSVCVWDMASNRLEDPYITIQVGDHEWSFGADSNSVLVLRSPSRVERWRGNAFQEMELLAPIGINGSSAIFSPDGQLLVVSSTNGSYEVWDLDRRTLLREFVGPKISEPWLVLAHNKRLIIFDKGNNSFLEWNLDTLQSLGSWPRQGVAAFSPEGSWYLGVQNGQGFLRALETGREQVSSLDIDYIWDATFSPDGKFFAISSTFGYAKLWETATQREIAAFRGLMMSVDSVAFAPDGKRLVTGSIGKEAIKIWDLDSYQELLTLEAKGAEFRQTRFSPDGNLLGSVDNRGVLHLWRAPPWEEIEAAEARENARQP